MHFAEIKGKTSRTNKDQTSVLQYDVVVVGSWDPGCR